MRRDSLVLAVALAGAVTLTALASGQDKYEIWAIDQSNSPGTTFGGTLYIWDGHDLEKVHGAASALAEKVDLAGAAAALCFAQTGANPVRPHMLSINPSQTHAIISFVASGHVLFNGCEDAPAGGVLSDVARCWRRTSSAHVVTIAG
jgi:hypothetical protein